MILEIIQDIKRLKPSPIKNPPMHQTTLHFPQIRLQRRDAHKLRGYFARTFGQDSDLWHNHQEDGRFIYRYPLIQYKVVDGAPMLIGIQKGAQLLIQRFLAIKELDINGRKIPVDQKNLNSREVEAGIQDQLFSYEFVNPWMALSQNNYRRFRDLVENERKKELERILIGNMLSFLKAIDVIVSERIMVTFPQVKEIPIQFKNTTMSGFGGVFSTNILLPDHIGLGKSAARGFGTIVKIN